MLISYLTLNLTIVTVFVSLFFLSKRLLLKCSVILIFLSVLTVVFNVFEPQILQFFVSKDAYDCICELLDVLLWLMFVGILIAGSRGEYKDKQQVEIENLVDENPENSFDKVMNRLPWDFEDEYIMSMDWPEGGDDYLKSSLKKKRDDAFNKKSAFKF